MKPELEETANVLRLAKYEIVTTGICQKGDKIITALSPTKTHFRCAENDDYGKPAETFDLLVRPTPALLDFFMRYEKGKR